MAMTQEHLAVVLFFVAIVGIAFRRARRAVPAVPRSTARFDEASQTFFALKSEIAFVNRTDIYGQAIKRTFADLYGVWTTGKTIVVQCAGKTSFIRSSAIPTMTRRSLLASTKTPSSST